jgi:ubiquinone/menaquinone biosynthesis C-methylase UbiE
MKNARQAEHMDTRNLLSLARGAEVTGIAWRSLARFYALPDVLNGLKVLDVCAGMSDSVYRLRQAGAQAYAIDTCYADLDEMLASHRKGFEVTARNVFGVEPDSQRGRQLYRSFTEGFVAGVEGSSYVAASATALPFGDAYFDLVLSFNGIFGTLDFAPVLLREALLEAVRVVRPGGSVQLLPFQQGPVLNDHERANQLAAVRDLASLPGIALHDRNTP